MAKVNIESIIKRTAQETVKELERNRLIKSDSLTYFQKTEKLLYSYPDLLQAIKQKEEDIKYIESYGVGETSKSVVLYTTGGGGSEQEKYVEIIEGYKASRERTKRLTEKIERAIDEIKEDKYYCIIEKKYFTKLTREEMEEVLNISESTIRRHRNRLINRLKVILFGADALE
ncbi:MAG: sigma-70 family RNA polymerase sigma factor [Anaeromicrobium sp.]|jgi:Txe/YoeB family toxin of Txe-Axe toxin-antitoxin module|uniref:sigma-70 family RNA polymerase sigma factor n=1 Tax=Anaeromicrobium sp. TaxID=1929132 RepID=UPI0025E85432|nr:sigma-70 family RNA polymerase sigma factor [Anaeromicrobium sp.]MCT4593162.1 sigma-70 family RNA polymerase sigma factor [Anaeromicrobium sp.]